MIISLMLAASTAVSKYIIHNGILWKDKVKLLCFCCQTMSANGILSSRHKPRKPCSSSCSRPVYNTGQNPRCGYTTCPPDDWLQKIYTFPHCRTGIRTRDNIICSLLLLFFPQKSGQCYTLPIDGIPLLRRLARIPNSIWFEAKMRGNYLS
jgi:hypothetical protein